MSEDSTSQHSTSQGTTGQDATGQGSTPGGADRRSRAPRVIAPRHVFRDLPVYRAGKPPRTVEGLKQFKLSSNENPLGPVPAVRAALEDFSATNLYPDPVSTRLREALADHLQVPADDVVTGAGSYGALSQIIAAFAGQDEDGSQDEVLYAWRSFEAYPIIVGLAGAKSVQVPLTEDGRHDLPAMAAALTDRTRVVILCTPNNPTGPALTMDEVRDFLRQVPEDVVVVLDEAYYEFGLVSEPTERERQGGGMAEGIALYREFPHLVVLRTFSKAAGLAGLRVGYSIAHQDITESLRVAAAPFTVTTLAENAAIAAIFHEEDILDQVRWIVGERERILAELRGQGWEIPESRANFVWLPLGERTAEFAEAAESQALAVRAFAGEGVRVSVGEKEANDRFLALCRNLAEGPASGAGTPAGRR